MTPKRKEEIRDRVKSSNGWLITAIEELLNALDVAEADIREKEYIITSYELDSEEDNLI